MKAKKKPKILKKIKAHLKEDMKTFTKEKADDKKLIKKINKVKGKKACK